MIHALPDALASSRAAPSRSRLLLVAALLLGACGQKGTGGAGGPGGPGGRGPTEVGAVTLVAQPVTVSTELTGRTTAALISDVRPQVDGIIKGRLFKEGSLVRAGQPLYKIDPRLYQATRDEAAAQLGNAQAALATAQAKAARYKRLSDIDAVSGQDRDDVIATARQSAANVAQYRATLRTAQVNLGFTNVLAPISGRIGRSAYTPGALVTASQTTALATIQQLDPIYVDITQSSQQLLDLRESLASGEILPTRATVQLILENGRNYGLTGRIEFGEVAVDQNAGTVTLRARFANPRGILLPGMFVRVQTPQGIAPNAILAPQQGISRDATGSATALVVGPDNKVAQREVVTSKAIGDRWLITSGLKAGDRLIVEGTDKAKPGATVKPVAASIGGAKPVAASGGAK